MVPVGGPTAVEFTSRLSLGKFLLLWVLLRGPIHFTRLLSYLQVHCVHQQLGKCALLRGHYGFMFYLRSTAISLPNNYYCPVKACNSQNMNLFKVYKPLFMIFLRRVRRERREPWNQSYPHYSPIRLLIRGVKTISIIGATMFNIIATIIYIVFTKIGGILKHLQCYNNDMGFAPT